MQREVVLVGGPHDGEVRSDDPDNPILRLTFRDVDPTVVSVYLPNPNNPDQFIYQPDENE